MHGPIRIRNIFNLVFFQKYITYSTKIELRHLYAKIILKVLKNYLNHVERTIGQGITKHSPCRIVKTNRNRKRHCAEIDNWVSMVHIDGENRKMKGRKIRCPLSDIYV